MSFSFDDSNSLDNVGASLASAAGQGQEGRMGQGAASSSGDQLAEEEGRLTPTTAQLLLDEGLAECIPALLSAGLTRIEDIATNNVKDSDLHIIGIQKPLHQKKLARLSAERAEMKRHRGAAAAVGGRGGGGSMPTSRQLTPQKNNNNNLHRLPIGPSSMGEGGGRRSPTLPFVNGLMGGGGGGGEGFGNHHRGGSSRSSTPSHHHIHHQQQQQQFMMMNGGRNQKGGSSSNLSVFNNSQSNNNNNNQNTTSTPPPQLLPFHDPSHSRSNSGSTTIVHPQQQQQQQQVVVGNIVNRNRTDSDPRSVRQYSFNESVGNASFGSDGNRGGANHYFPLQQQQQESEYGVRRYRTPPLSGAQQQPQQHPQSPIFLPYFPHQQHLQHQQQQSPSSRHSDVGGTPLVFGSSFGGQSHFNNSVTGGGGVGGGFSFSSNANHTNNGPSSSFQQRPPHPLPHPFAPPSSTIHHSSTAFMMGGGGSVPTTPSVRERILRRQREREIGLRRASEGGDHILMHVIAAKTAPHSTYPLSADRSYRVRVGLCDFVSGEVAMKKETRITTPAAKGPNPLFLFDGDGGGVAGVISTASSSSNAAGSNSSTKGGPFAGFDTSSPAAAANNSNASSNVHNSTPNVHGANGGNRQENSNTQKKKKKNVPQGCTAHSIATVGTTTSSQDFEENGEGEPVTTYGDDHDSTCIKVRTNFMRHCVGIELLESRPFFADRVVGCTVFPINFFYNFNSETIVDNWFPIRRAEAKNANILEMALEGIAEGSQMPFTSPNNINGNLGDNAIIAAIRLVLEVPGGCPQQVGKAFHISSINMKNRFFRLEVFEAILFQNTSAANKFVHKVNALTSPPSTPSRGGAADATNSPSPDRRQHRQNINITLSTSPPKDLYFSIRVNDANAKTRRRTRVIKEATYRPAFNEDFIWTDEVSESKCITLLLKRKKGGFAKPAVVGAAHIPLQFFLSQSQSNSEEKMAVLVDVHNPLLVRACVHVRLTVAPLTKMRDAKPPTQFTVEAIEAGTAVPLHIQQQSRISLMQKRADGGGGGNGPHTVIIRGNHSSASNDTSKHSTPTVTKARGDFPTHHHAALPVTVEATDGGLPSNTSGVGVLAPNGNGNGGGGGRSGSSPPLNSSTASKRTDMTSMAGPPSGMRGGVEDDAHSSNYYVSSYHGPSDHLPYTNTTAAPSLTNSRANRSTTYSLGAAGVVSALTSLSTGANSRMTFVGGATATGGAAGRGGGVDTSLILSPLESPIGIGSSFSSATAAAGAATAVHSSSLLQGVKGSPWVPPDLDAFAQQRAGHNTKGRQQPLQRIGGGGGGVAGAPQRLYSPVEGGSTSSINALSMPRLSDESTGGGHIHSNNDDDDDDDGVQDVDAKLRALRTPERGNGGGMNRMGANTKTASTYFSPFSPHSTASPLHSSPISAVGGGNGMAASGVADELSLDDDEDENPLGAEKLGGEGIDISPSLSAASYATVAYHQQQHRHSGVGGGPPRSSSSQHTLGSASNSHTPTPLLSHQRPLNTYTQFSNPSHHQHQNITDASSTPFPPPLPPSPSHEQQEKGRRHVDPTDSIRRHNNNGYRVAEDDDDHTYTYSSLDVGYLKGSDRSAADRRGGGGAEEKKSGLGLGSADHQHHHHQGPRSDMPFRPLTSRMPSFLKEEAAERGDEGNDGLLSGSEFDDSDVDGLLLRPPHRPPPTRGVLRAEGGGGVPLNAVVVGGGVADDFLLDSIDGDEDRALPKGIAQLIDDGILPLHASLGGSVPITTTLTHPPPRDAAGSVAAGNGRPRNARDSHEIMSTLAHKGWFNNRTGVEKAQQQHSADDGGPPPLPIADNDFGGASYQANGKDIDDDDDDMFDDL